MIRYFIVLISVILVSCSGSLNKNANVQDQTHTQEYILKSVNFEELRFVFLQNNDTLYLINFWATWCKPCIEELPDFMQIQADYEFSKPFKLILVSLDRPSAFESTLVPFLKNHSITADVYLLDDITRMNEWIPAIDSTWSGAIPATVLYKNKQKLEFHEQQLTKETLQSIISQYL